MVTFYCPHCWRVVDHADKVCPHCRTEIAELLHERDYTAKLIAALTHSEPTTPVRAASLLGTLRARRAVPPLIELAESTADIYQRAAAIEALGKIADPQAEPVLERILTNGPDTLRPPARTALHELRTRMTEPQPRVNEFTKEAS
jgi:HEAT repeat protein